MTSVHSMNAKQVLLELKKYKHYEEMTDYQIKKTIGGDKLALVAELQDALKKEQRKERKLKKTTSEKEKTKKTKTLKTEEPEKKTKKTKITKPYEPLKYETCYIFTIWTSSEIEAGYDQAEHTYVLKNNNIEHIRDIFQRYMYNNREQEMKHNKFSKEYEFIIESAMNNLPVLNGMPFVTAERTDFQTARMII